MINSTLCYLRRGQDVLLLHRVKKENDLNHDKWIGVGGKFEDRESPEDCALREIREETGLAFSPAQGRCLLQLQRRDDFLDVWLFEGSFTLEQVVLQPGETCGKRLASAEEILSLAESEALVPYSYLQALFANPALLRYNHS